MPSPWLLLVRLGLLFVVVVSLGAIWRVSGQRWGAALRTRFLAGVPWGTLLTVCWVLAVYLFVQGGLSNWFQPVALPFRAWSYRYPLGMAVAPFAHVGPNHLTSNLVGTLAFAPLTEYAWSHYPTERGSQTFSSLATNPFVRALAVPSAAVLAGLFTSLFAIGPIIGFSGVVFAFAGFALVRYPLATVVAFSASEVLRLVYNAIQNPVVEASAEPSFGTPWWAGIAIQAHAIGLLLGILVGIVVFRRRAGRPSAERLWLGTLVFAVGQSLWAVYWFRGNDVYVLFRAVGAVLVFSLALVVAASVAAAGRFPSTRTLVGGVRHRGAAAVVILLALAVLSAPAIPVNLVAYDTGESALAAGNGSTDTLSVRDYTITYAENVTNQLVSVFNISVLGETTTVNASGVIVESERRHIWTTAVGEDRLAFAGCATVRLGGLGWTERVHVSRTGWRAVGGEHVYKIYLNGPGDGRRLAYRSAPATAEPTIRGKNVSVVPRKRGFGLVVSRANETLGRAPLPKNGTTARAANLTFSRNGTRLFASVGETRVRVAKQETYN
jgi:membrane associated rhomboid family serine protease